MTTVKMYEPDNDDELNKEFRMVEHYDNSENYDKQNIPRVKKQPIKNTKENKPSFLTVKKSSLKETQVMKTNEEDKYQIMDTSY